MKDIAAAWVQEELFSKNNYTDVYGIRAYHKQVHKDATKFLKTLNYIIPDHFMHPEIMVTIDFTHQFTISEKTTSGKIEGRRPISKEVLLNTGIDLVNFFTYYFEYVLTKDSAAYRRSELKTLAQRVRNKDEEALSLFINQIINFFITDVQVERSRTDIGSATITLKDTPNNKAGNDNNLLFNKTNDVLNQLFVPMLPITIWAKGRLYKDWFMPIFDGYIIAATSANTEGFFTLTLACKDVLELARISHEMLNPAIIQAEEVKGQDNLNIYAKPLYGQDHFAIFKAMFKGGRLKFNPDTLTSQVSFDPTAKGTHNFSQLEDFEEVHETSSLSLEDLAANKARAMYSPGSSDLAHGTANLNLSDESINTPEVKALRREAKRRQAGQNPPQGFTLETALQFTSHKKRRRKIIYWGYNITPYRLLQFSAPAPFSSEFSSRLDVLREVSSLVYYELYVDAWGDVRYHPMRFSNEYFWDDYLFVDNVGNYRKGTHIFPGAQVIGPEELLNSSSLFNSEELVTFLRFSGVPAFVPGLDAVPAKLIKGVIDEPRMARFGYRRREVVNPLFNFDREIPDSDGGTGSLIELAARELLTYLNGELYTLQASIIFRPELDLALPVLLLPENNVFYINTLSHSISIGGDATTTINGSFGRKENQPPSDIASYILWSQKLYIVNLTGEELYVEGASENYKYITGVPVGSLQTFLIQMQQEADKLAEKYDPKRIEEEKAKRRKKAAAKRAKQKEIKDIGARSAQLELNRKLSEGSTVDQILSRAARQRGGEF